MGKGLLNEGSNVLPVIVMSRQDILVNTLNMLAVAGRYSWPDRSKWILL